MVLPSDSGLQWRWAHNQSAFCKLAQHSQDFFLISGVPLPLDISQHFLTHMQLLCLLCQVSNFLFSLLGILPSAQSHFLSWHTFHKLEPTMQWTTSLAGIRYGTRVSMVCWESQELKNKISGSPKCLQNQHIPISEGGAALLLCLPWPFPAFQSEGLFCVSGWFLLVLPSQHKCLPHTHVLTITYNTELSLFCLIIHWLSHSLLSPRWQYLEFWELRGPTVSAYTLIKKIL